MLTATYDLARQLATRHDVEIVSAVRFAETALRGWPSEVPVRVLADVRDGQPTPSPPATPMTTTPPGDGTSTAEQRNGFIDLRLAQFLESVTDGAVVTMQPHLSVALARLGQPSLVRVAQEHRPFASRPRSQRRLARQFYPRLDAVVTLTERDARRYRRLLGVATQVETIPNAAPVFDVAPSDCENRVVVAAGQKLGRGKGFDLLLVAWARVAQRCPGWELRIFGQGPNREKLEQQADELGLSDSVRLMGYSTRLDAEMAAASMFVLSSRWEGYPMVLLEAMSCGLPVVAFDCSTGPREIIEPGVDGLLVRNGDVDRLADALCRMIEAGPEERRRFGAAGLASARQRSHAGVAARWQGLLERLDRQLTPSV